MLKKILKNKLKITLILVLVLLLATIRAYEEDLFYDPFLAYFKGDYLSLPFPEFNDFRLFFGLTFRYFLNTIFSLGIIHVLFLDSKFIKFTALLYFIFYLVLIGVFFLAVHFLDKENNFVLFYIRRFLIQPLFLLLFIPAFFYQKKIK
jgi:exosortase F-associated protein